MASSFGRYTGGIEASTGNLVPAYGQMAAQTVAVGVGFGQNIAQGLQAYNDNSAKNDILISEAEALGQQIQQYAQMFGESPEHKAFADSLAPYIEKLSKVPSMSLTQKMGTVTSVKAGFANIGQQLQVFELMRGERMKRDMNVARGGVKEYDEVTVPTAIIPSGKMPYFHDKSYMENEAEITRLATEAKGKGANVDIAKVLSDWRADFKASAMSRTDMPPEVKEALIKQIDAGEGLESNIQTDDSGVTDYAKEADMYGRTSTSVKEQLIPAKVEAPATPSSATKVNELRQKSFEIEKAIATLNQKGKVQETISDAEFNKLVDKETGGSTYIAKSNLKEKGWKMSYNDKGKIVWTRQTSDKPTAEALAKYRTELNAIKQEEYNINNEQIAKAKTPQGEIEALQERKRLIEKEKNNLDRIEGSVLPTLAGWTSRQISDAMQNQPAFQALARSRKMITGEQITPEVAKELVEEFSSMEHMGIPLVGGSIKALFDTIINLGGAENLTRKDKQNIATAINDYKSKMNSGSEYRNTGIDKSPEREIVDIDERIERLQRKLPSTETPQGTQSAQNTQTSNVATGTQEAQPEPSYTLTNQRNMSLGTTTAQIASSVESKRNDMKAFFTQKYGYIPASFEESFKAIYPEANFKTMETPYGVFMHDGKDWKQVQLQEPKVMSRKEMAEEKAVSFGKLQSDSSIDINEFGELVPNSGVFVRGIFGGSPSDASKFRTQMLEGSNAKRAVGRLIEINEMAGESMLWNAKLWGEAKALLPQIKAGLRIDIIGVGTVSNYEQQLIEDVVADPTKFWSLEASDRAKLAVIMDKISNKLIQEPANHGLDVKVGGRTNAQREKEIRMGALGAGKSKLQLDYEARGGKKGTSLNWDNAAKLPDAFKKALTD